MIRDATKSDLPVLSSAMLRLQQLHVDAFPEIYKPFTASAAVSHLSDLISQPDVKVRVLIQSNQIVGHAVLAVETTPANMFKHAQRYGHLTQIEVDPAIANWDLDEHCSWTLKRLLKILDLTVFCSTCGHSMTQREIFSQQKITNRSVRNWSDQSSKSSDDFCAFFRGSDGDLVLRRRDS